MMIKNVIEYLKQSAQEHPNKIAFSDENGSVTFAEADKKARQIATAIQNEFIAPSKNNPIAVYMPRSVDCLMCFLGIAYSGNFYTPLDTRSPKNRIDNILSVLSPKMVITTGDNRLEIQESIPELSLNDIYSIVPMEDDFLYGYHRVLDIDPLYVLFTSGSTGIPKGVTIAHRGVIDYTEWLKDIFTFDSNTVFGNQAPFHFDNSILDIYSTLKNGSTMVILPENLFMVPSKLIDYMNSKSINTIFWVPSALVGVANSGVLDNNRLDYIERILFCGEVMPTKQFNVWRKHYPNVVYANLYGPTEITDVCAYYIIERHFEDNEMLPIGKACDNMEILVLNDNDVPVKGDELGELCVRGCGLSMGYYGNEEKTSAAFVQNPLNHEYKDVIYRTGDIVHYNQFGEIVYDCRKDFQIKYQGHRIELGEIDAAGSAIEGVDTCCTLFDDENKRILFYYVSMEGMSEKEIYKGLKQMLPSYMLPAKITKLVDMPLNINGKIDRVRLGEMAKNG